MKKYLYIEARNMGGGSHRPLVSFTHVRVDALHEEDAYRAGQDECAHLEKTQGSSPLFQDGHFLGKFLNDYVVEV